MASKKQTAKITPAPGTGAHVDESCTGEFFVDEDRLVELEVAELPAVPSCPAKLLPWTVREGARQATRDDLVDVANALQTCLGLSRHYSAAMSVGELRETVHNQLQALLLRMRPNADLTAWTDDDEIAWREEREQY